MKRKEAVAVIKSSIQGSSRAAISALLMVYQMQTNQEKYQETTVEDNGVGFSGADAEILTSFAKFYGERGYLTQKQTEVASRRMVKYSGQILGLALDKGTWVVSDDGNDYSFVGHTK